MLVHLVTGSSWEDCERLSGNKASDTTVRGRGDEWEAGGVFDAVAEETIVRYAASPFRCCIHRYWL
jgi:hypothetical protein